MQAEVIRTPHASSMRQIGWIAAVAVAIALGAFFYYIKLGHRAVSTAPEKPSPQATTVSPAIPVPTVISYGVQKPYKVTVDRDQDMGLSGIALRRYHDARRSFWMRIYLANKAQIDAATSKTRHGEFIITPGMVLVIPELSPEEKAMVKREKPHSTWLTQDMLFRDTLGSSATHPIVSVDDGMTDETIRRTFEESSAAKQSSAGSSPAHVNSKKQPADMGHHP